MTEDQVSRAKNLIASRDAIREFLSARDPNSPLVQGYVTAQCEFQRRDGDALPTATIVELTITGASHFEEEDYDSHANFMISRDVVERALSAELPRIADELASLGISDG